MKITDIRVEPLRIRGTLVRVFTDEGLVGLGEAPGFPGLKGLIEDGLLPIVQGKDPRKAIRLWDEMFYGTSRTGSKGLQTSAIGAIDIACWDIAAKAAGMPLCDLLGGPARTTMPVYLSLGMGWEQQPEQMLERVQQGYADGFRAFKIRMDWNANRQDANPSKDLRMFELCRSFLPPDVPLSFDANNGYSVSTAIRQGKAFEVLGIAHFEEPLPQYDYLGLRQVTDALDVPVSSGEQEHTRWQFRDLIQIGNPDILQPDIVMAGGISEVRRIFDLATAFNKPIMPHCPSAGVSSAASLHLYSTFVNAVRPHEYQVWDPEILDLYREPILPRNGMVTLPDRPGLGLEIDERALERLRR
ncbi:MAG: mandelate racemase/muconate lactonizing enzyme family protein [Chloroflexi bacterium]|nr:mandelate racemase/muconate lactonizing enzyme family protein [Chloroflexota bacterium]